MSKTIEFLETEKKAVQAGLVKLAARDAYLDELLALAREGEAKTAHRVQETRRVKLNLATIQAETLSKDILAILKTNPQKTFITAEFRDILWPLWASQFKGKDAEKRFKKRVDGATNYIRTHTEEVHAKKLGRKQYMRWGAKPTVSTV